MKTTVKGIKG